MKFYVALLVVLVVAVCGEPRQKRFLIDSCSSDSDCGVNRCCLLGKICMRKLPKYSTCLLTSITNCGCGDGLACRVTKEFTVLGQTITLRQCMETGEKIHIEKLDDQDVKEIVEKRPKRFLIDRCTKESDCGDDKCCLLNRYCAPKISEGYTCYLTQRHKCGCAYGLECRITTYITIPILGTKIPIRQCVKPSV